MLQVLIINLSACTTLMWEGNSTKSYQHEFQQQSSDPLLGMGQLPADKQHAARYVFVGQEYMYVVERGNEDIQAALALVQQPANLRLVTGRDKVLRFAHYAGAGSTAQFVGRVQLEYTVPPTEQQTITAWQQLDDYRIRPMQEKTTLVTNIRVFVTPQNRSNTTTIQPNGLPAGDYRIALGQYLQTTTVDVSQLLNNAVATPFTLVSDLVTIPLKVVNEGSNTLLPKFQTPQ